MQMSQRNHLLLDMQNELQERTGIWIKMIEAANDIEFTSEEIQGALKGVILSYGVI